MFLGECSCFRAHSARVFFSSSATDTLSSLTSTKNVRRFVFCPLLLAGCSPNSSASSAFRASSSLRSPAHSSPRLRLRQFSSRSSPCFVPTLVGLTAPAPHSRVPSATLFCSAWALVFHLVCVYCHVLLSFKIRSCLKLQSEHTALSTHRNPLACRIVLEV